MSRGKKHLPCFLTLHVSKNTRDALEKTSMNWKCSISEVVRRCVDRQLQERKQEEVA